MVDLSVSQDLIVALVKYFVPVLLFIVLLKLLLPKIKGYIGEKSVSNHLSKLPSDHYFTLDDIMIPGLNGTSQIDHVVVSSYGVFAIETKNYDGWIYGNEKDKYWTQVLNKRTRHRFLNPLRQNYGHVKALEDLLSVKDIHSIVTFVNGTIKTELPENVMRLGDVNKYIQNFKTEVFDSGKVDQLLSIIRNSNISDRQIRKNHVKRVKAVKNINRASR